MIDLKIEITNFKRQGLFDYYHKKENPFLYVITKVDITNLYKYINLEKIIVACMKL